MIIDIEPLIEFATGTQRIAMEIYEETERYVIRYANGLDYSTIFNVKSFNEFLPTRNVSDVIREWVEGLNREYNTAATAASTGIHPYWSRHIENPNRKYFEPKLISVPYEMNEHEIDGWERLAKRKFNNLGQLTFHKLILVE